MDIIKKIFYILLIFSLLFLFAGIYSGYTLANIEKSREVLILENPQNVTFSYSYSATSYTLRIKITVKNSGVYDYGIEKITWVCSLLNNSNESAKYQANDYQIYYPQKTYVKAGRTMEFEIVDNKTTEQWEKHVIKNLLWQINKYGKLNITWHNEISIDGWLGNFDHDRYKYNVKTWYLWHLPEVLIKYAGNTRGD